MKNYICINKQKIQLTEDQVEKIRSSLGVPAVKLADVTPGDTVKVAECDFVVLEQSGDTTALILKDFLYDSKAFGSNNDFAGSAVDEICQEFACKISASVGEENLVMHTVDLTSDDGLKDYGMIQRKASLLTADRYRQYVAILDKYKIDAWWWLATAFSTPAHDDDRWVKCVSPSGYFSYYGCSNDNFGVRPFLFLNSSIFESSEM